VAAGEILDMRMLDINNQDCIRKRKNRAYLGRDSFRKSFVRGRILSSTNLKLKRQIGKYKKRKRQIQAAYHVEPRKPGFVYKWPERHKLDCVCDGVTPYKCLGKISDNFHLNNKNN